MNVAYTYRGFRKERNGQPVILQQQTYATEGEAHTAMYRHLLGIATPETISGLQRYNFSVQVEDDVEIFGEVAPIRAFHWLLVREHNYNAIPSLLASQPEIATTVLNEGDHREELMTHMMRDIAARFCYEPAHVALVHEQSALCGAEVKSKDGCSLTIYKLLPTAEYNEAISQIGRKKEDTNA